jgi:hypothetical protein
MFCTACGTKAQEGSAHCTNCGAALPASQSSQAGAQAAAPSSQTYSGIPQGYSGEPGAAMGCLVLFVSIFTMPFKTAVVAVNELRTIAREGILNSETDFPHLSWFKTALPVIATLMSVIVFVLGLLYAIDTMGNSYSGGVAKGLGIIIISAFLAIISDWVIMIIGEQMTIKVAEGRYYTRRNKKED